MTHSLKNDQQDMNMFHKAAYYIDIKKALLIFVKCNELYCTKLRDLMRVALFSIAVDLTAIHVASSNLIS